MKYKDFNGTVDELVLLKVKEIEEREHIKVLHVVESGSISTDPMLLCLNGAIPRWCIIRRKNGSRWRMDSEGSCGDDAGDFGK